ncbi:hypothetical protein [Flavobacterium sp. FlaQc-47]|uniref:hypothetical protein n=1 Tax=Flavobacterium sp. FlaQc-47 TaxID=3374180 RepID=UPI0037575AE4
MDKKYHILIFIFSLIVLLVANKINKSKAENSLGDYDFSIGNVEAYFNRGTIGHNVGRSSITYSYIVGNIRYVNNYDMLFYKLPYSPNTNDKFVVAYNKKDPQKSILLGDFPIKTNQDFKIFVDTHEDFKIKF